jgi:hypothetical protein
LIKIVEEQRFSRYHVHFLRFFFEHFKTHKKEGAKILKTKYAVFVYYKLESKYKKSSKFEEVIVQSQKKCLISNDMRQIFIF